MRIFTSVFGLLVLAFVVLFVLSNRQDVVIALWPFANTWQMPLYIVGLSPFVLGGILGIFWGWMGALPHRKRAKSLNKELKSLNDKIGELQSVSIVKNAKIKTKSFWKP